MHGCLTITTHVFLYFKENCILLLSVVFIFFLFLVPLELWVRKDDKSSTTNVLGLVMFSVILGTAIGRLQPLSEPLQSLCHALSETMMIITNWVIW